MSEQQDEPRRDSTAATVWMVTFTDLVSLMLTFFVMLFAMSSLRPDQWDKVTDALSRSFDPTSEKTVRGATPAPFNIGTVVRRQAAHLDYLDAVLRESLLREPDLAASQLFRLEDRLIISLPGDILFEPGLALMTERAEALLFGLGGVLRNIGNRVAVEGHSDPHPPAAGGYTSNWELSTARAAAVANALKRAGYGGAVAAFGHSDSRFGWLPERPDGERRAMARRVDIVVLPTAGEP